MNVIKNIQIKYVMLRNNKIIHVSLYALLLMMTANICHDQLSPGQK